MGLGILTHTHTHFKFNSIDHPGTIGQWQIAVVWFSLCPGLCSQDRCSPLRHAPLVIAPELVGNATYCLNTGDRGGLSPIVNSTSWVIEHPQMKCDIVTCGSELHNSYAAHLLSGKSRPMHVSIYATNTQQAQGMDNSIPIDRSLTRLKLVFVSLFHGGCRSTHNIVALYFYHPMISNYNKPICGVSISNCLHSVPRILCSTSGTSMLQLTQHAWYYQHWRSPCAYQQTALHGRPIRSCYRLR